MFRFANPEYFYLFVLPAALALIYILARHLDKRRMERYGQASLLARLVPNHSRLRPHLKFLLLELALVLLVVSLARPQLGMRGEKIKKTGFEAVVSIDVSNSMLAIDVSPSRLERAKMLVRDLVAPMEQDKIALQVFAGEAYPILPITSDYAATNLFLNSISAGMVTLQGTNLAAAIDLAASSFTANEKVGKAIIIITDGEDHEGGAVEAAEEAAKKGLHLYVLGIGSPDGAQIPTKNGPLRDSSGAAVRTALNEDMCRELALAGNGAYIHVDNTNAAGKALHSQLEALQKVDQSTVYTAYDEQFRAVALLAFILLLLEPFISETVNPWLRKIKLFKKRNHA